MNIVAGAFGSAGRHIAQILLNNGQRVGTMTNRRRDDVDEDDSVDWKSIPLIPYAFRNPRRLVDALHGCDTLYNTYWVRLAQGPLEFTQAVRTSQLIIHAAKRAHMNRFVHVSAPGPRAVPSSPTSRARPWWNSASGNQASPTP